MSPGSDKAAEKDAALRAAAAKHLIAGERVELGETVGSQYITVTDRRIVITRIGMLTGERSESIPLKAVTSIAATMREDRVILLELAVPGRTWGELTFSGEDLGRIYAALIRCLPVERSAA